MQLSILITAIVGYFVGCFQTSYILIKFIKKEDIRKYGFGNAGASNTVSSFGWKLGAVVAVVDILKPAVAYFILNRLAELGFINIYSYTLILSGLFVILGHNYPFYLQFKGGKGTASLIGLVILINFHLGMLGLGLFVTFSIITNYIVLGTLAFIVYFVGMVVYLNLGSLPITISLIISLQSIYLHIPNFKRILDNTETKISSKIKKIGD